LGPPISQFLKIINVCDGRRKTIYDAINDLNEERGLSNKILITISRDDSSSMVGNEIGFVIFLKRDIPNIVGIHSIDIYEAPTTLDASKRITKLLFVEKLENNIYSWVQNSTKRNSQLISLHEHMQLETLQSLQIHGVIWLSRGQLIERSVVWMPPMLTLWKYERNDSCYDDERIFSV
jgi:hypothetical protein